MLTGHGQVKAKSIKYLNDGRFELILTNVAPNDIMELLRCSGKFVNFQFGETIKTDQGYQDQPENERLFTTDGSGVVEMAEPSEAAEEPCSDSEGVYICDSCGLHIGELGEDGDDACPECEVGKLIYHDSSNADVVMDTALEPDEIANESDNIANEPNDFANDPDDVTNEPDGDSILDEMTEEEMEGAALSEMFEAAANA